MRQPVRDYCQDDHGDEYDTQLAWIESLAGRTHQILQKLHPYPDDQLHRH
jgi:hypothetical protein